MARRKLPDSNLVEETLRIFRMKFSGWYKNNRNMESTMQKNISRFIKITSFLLTIRGDSKKNFIMMANDYFNQIENHMGKFGRGVHIMHIDGNRAKTLYKEFVNVMGTNYWNEKPSSSRWLPTFEDRFINVSSEIEADQLKVPISTYMGVEDLKEYLRGKFEAATT